MIVMMLIMILHYSQEVIYILIMNVEISFMIKKMDLKKWILNKLVIFLDF